MKRANLQVEGDGDWARSLGRICHLPAEVLEVKLLCKKSKLALGKMSPVRWSGWEGKV